MLSFLLWVLLGAALAYEKDMHLGLDVVETRLPEKVRSFMVPFRRLLVILFSVIMIKQGFTLATTLTARTPILDLPFSKIYLILPVMMALILMVAIMQFFQDLGRLKATFSGNASQETQQAEQ